MAPQMLVIPRSWTWATQGTQSHIRPVIDKGLSRAAGSRRRRSPTISPSPSRIISLRLQQRKPRWLVHYGEIFRVMAKMRNERLPLITLHKLLKQQDLRREAGLAAIVENSDPVVWKDRMNSMATRGWSEDDIDHWVWILSGKDGDERIQRFVSKDTVKPLFLLFTLLSSSQRIVSDQSLKSILDYISKFHIPSTRHRGSADKERLEFSPDPRTDLDTAKFLILLRRIVKHVLRIWPRAIVTVAQLVHNYIQAMPKLWSGRSSEPHFIYHKRCLIFNAALSLFSKPASMNPVRNMEFNWQAQKFLLAMSDAMPNPLIIQKSSYTATRKVMVAQKRSAAEVAVAMRYGKRWPPYRQDFDGQDAKRAQVNDQSRSVKAGVMMVEAGYEEDVYDKALSIIGGKGHDSPTIQTRSLAPKRWKREKEKDNVYSLWAMRVRATRNAQEAWRAFNSFPNTQPNFQVYSEMFLKIQAEENPNPEVLPGDTREAHPIYHANYSEYELSRLTPPTVETLFGQMIASGIQPEGVCLQNLVSNAKSLEQALRYLRKSPIDRDAVQHLALHHKSSYPILRRIPLLLFSSYIKLLCRLQPDRRGITKPRKEELMSIRHAINLATLRLEPGTAEGARFKSPWHSIFRALCRPYVAVVNEDILTNDAASLSLFLEVYKFAEKVIGLDTEVLIYLCRNVQKVIVSYFETCCTDTTSSNHLSPMKLIQGDTRLGQALKDASDTLNTMITKMTTPVEQLEGDLELPAFLHVISPVELHAVMRTLAFLGDVPGMIRLMRWIISVKDIVNEEADRAHHRGDAMLAKTLCAFSAFARPYLTSQQRDELDAVMDRIGQDDPQSGWRWPTSGEIEEYIDSDARGGNQKLRQRIADHIKEEDNQE